MAVPVGPLHGLKVIELAGLAPGPFAGLVLADYGADVVRVDRRPQGNKPQITSDSLTRGKRSIGLDLKDENDKAKFLDLVRVADVLIEGYRPHVMESLGLGPHDCQKLNKRLIYARLTGFHRTGKYASSAGHDINYLAVSGVLNALGPSNMPSPPGNLLGDFAGGGLTCALGILLALQTRHKTGLGTVVEANMVDGASYISTFIRHAQSIPHIWGGPRGSNLLDGGAPFYRCYETSDGKFVAVAALEPQFYQIFIQKLGLKSEELEQCQDQSRDNWAHLESVIERRFKELRQEEWCTIYDGTDACVTPVLEKILPTKIPVSVDNYVGLPNSTTHRNGRELVGLRPGQDQESVFANWLKVSKANL